MPDPSPVPPQERLRPARRGRYLAVTVAAVLPLAGVVSPAAAVTPAPSPTSSAAAVAAQVAQATIAAGADVDEVSPTAPVLSGGALLGGGAQTTTGAGATRAELPAVVDVASAALPVKVALPVVRQTTAVQTAAGTAVLSDRVAAVDVAVQNLQGGGVRVSTVLNSAAAPTVHRYPLTLPAGARLVAVPGEGQVLVVVKEGRLPAAVADAAGTGVYDYTRPLPPSTGDTGPDAPAPEPAFVPPLELAADDVPILRIERPWAVDARGVLLPTSYTIEGSTLVQRVTVTGATFPVVADPFFVPVVVALTAAAARAAAPAVARAFAAQALRSTATPTVKGGFNSFSAFKRAHVTGKEKTHDWHHVVEQSNITRHRWDARTIHNKKNMIQVPRAIHQKCVNANMASKNVSLPGWTSGPYNTLRDSIKSLSWQRQYEIGILLLRYCGVKV